MVKHSMICEGRCISSWKNTPGPSEKEYDFWQTLIAASSLGKYSKRWVPEEVIDLMSRVTPQRAWICYMEAKHPGVPWGLVDTDEAKKWKRK